jgi:hypothetical protein
VSAPRPPRACRTARQRMALGYYGALDPSDDGSLRRHLASCPDCSREWDLLKRALDACDPQAVFPLEKQVDWREFARSTASRARAAAAAGRSTESPAVPGVFVRPWRLALPTAAGLIGLAAGLVVAILAVNGWLRPGGPRTEHLSSPSEASDGAPPATLLESANRIEDRLAHQGAARYLRDSRALLMNLVGAAAPCRKADGHYDITLEKEKSRQLLRRKNLYEGDLLTLEDQRLATLLRQLESVLMEVTTLDDCATARQIHDLREQVEKREILLRIDLMTREMQRREHVV